MTRDGLVAWMTRYADWVLLNLDTEDAWLISLDEEQWEDNEDLWALLLRGEVEAEIISDDTDFDLDKLEPERC